MTELTVTITDNRLINGKFGDISFADWGIECSDRSSFVTLTAPPRNAFARNGIWHLSDGRLRIDLDTTHPAPDRIDIHARFTALDPVRLQDAVVRLVFEKNNILHGIIANQTVRHTNSDKYRLYPVKQAELISRSGHRASVYLTGYDGATRFNPYLYLRDRDDHWIIHARLLPIDPVDQVWLRWANRFFTLSAPDSLAKWLWHIGPVRCALWRLRERMGRRCPELQAVPLNQLEAGQSLSLEVSCHFR